MAASDSTPPFEEQKRAEQSIRLVADTTPALLHTGRPDGYLDYFNRGWLDFLGAQLEEIEGWNWTSRVHPDDVDELVRRWRSSLASGTALECETRVRRFDGQYRRLLHRKLPLRDADGQIVKWFGSSIDIEERMQAEFYLAQAQRLAHTGSWAFNSGGFEYWSPQLFEIHGLEPGREAPNIAEYMALVHPEDRDFVAQTIQEMLSDHRGFDFTKRIVRPDGAIRHVRCVGVPGPNGRAFVGTGIDVTEQEQLTKALRKSESQWRAVFENSSVGIVLIDENIRVVSANDAYQKMVGYTESELQKMDPREYTHPEDLQASEAIYTDIRENRRDSAYYEKRYRRGDGRVVWVECYATRLPSVGSFDALFAAVVVDITERKAARKAIEDAFDEIKKLKDELHRENVALKEEIDQASMFEEIVGSSKTLKKVLEDVVKVAPTDSTVLITGETGTGKELVARAIHKRSRRAGRAFIRVNCAAIAPSLIASELFGHERGAFTGATQRREGRFEMAAGGTLFLDEIGELPEETQVALLRVLQEREFERVGGNKTLRSDVRVVAATNRDLEEAIRAGKFRRDLFYRLNVFPIAVPPLRNRREDIPRLVEAFVREFSKLMAKKISSIPQKTMTALQRYDWPGNIRELRNMIERGMVISRGRSLEVELPMAVANTLEPSKPRHSAETTLADVERRHILDVLQQTKWKIGGRGGAAERLGMNRTTLQGRMRKLKINRSE